MTSRLGSSLVLSLLLSLIAAARATGAAAAEAPAVAPVPAPTAAVRAEARQRFDRGVGLFERGENAGALAEFKRAYGLIPNPLLLYNMGLVYAAMNRPVEATDTLSDFLSQGGSSASAEQRKHAEAVRAEQSQRVAQLVVLTSTPATIEVDGIEAGRTPLAKPIRLTSGAHVVAVLAPGYLPSHKEVSLAGQTTETVSLTLLPSENRLAQLVVRASLPGAEVRVNGKRVGVTPLPASVAVPPGSVRVELYRAGYRSAALTIAIDEGARGELNFALEEDPSAPMAIKGRLLVSASEPGVQLSLDGAPLKPLAGPLLVASGPHAIRVERSGFEPAERAVSVPPGRDTPLVVTLVPTPETRARYEESVRVHRIAGWSLAGAGVLVAAGSVIYTVMSQHDLSGARDQLDLIAAREMMASDPCFANNPDYAARGCGMIRADAQSQVDSSSLHRTFGFVGVAVGAALLGTGAYFLLSGEDRDRYGHFGPGPVAARFWSDGQGAGLILDGRF